MTRKMKPQTAHGILRVIAFVLPCIGVQISNSLSEKNFHDCPAVSWRKNAITVTESQRVEIAG